MSAQHSCPVDAAPIVVLQNVIFDTTMTHAAYNIGSSDYRPQIQHYMICLDDSTTLNLVHDASGNL